MGLLHPTPHDHGKNKVRSSIPVRECHSMSQLEMSKKSVKQIPTSGKLPPSMWMLTSFTSGWVRARFLQGDEKHWTRLNHDRFWQRRQMKTPLLCWWKPSSWFSKKSLQQHVGSRATSFLITENVVAYPLHRDSVIHLVLQCHSHLVLSLGSRGSALTSSSCWENSLP